MAQVCRRAECINQDLPCQVIPVMYVVGLAMENTALPAFAARIRAVRCATAFLSVTKHMQQHILSLRHSAESMCS
jgi:hypothetical protein